MRLHALHPRHICTSGAASYGYGSQGETHTGQAYDIRSLFCNGGGGSSRRGYFLVGVRIKKICIQTRLISVPRHLLKTAQQAVFHVFSLRTAGFNNTFLCGTLVSKGTGCGRQKCQETIVVHPRVKNITIFNDFLGKRSWCSPMRESVRQP